MEWNIDPVLIGFGPVQIRWYGLMFVIGFSIGYWYVNGKFIKNGLTEAHSNSLLNYLVLGTMIGARLGHCLFYDPGYYLTHPWKIPMIWEGGLASHGGYIGILIAMYLYMKKYKDDISFLEVTDVVAGPAVLTGAFIRLGNFFNSEILGHPADVPWAIVFKAHDLVPRHPAQLYESLGYATCGMIGFILYKYKRPGWPVGRTLGWVMICSFTFRFFIETFKENQMGWEDGLFINMGQILSIPLVLVGVFFVWAKYNESTFLGKPIMTKKDLENRN
jgi:phosphatidylglycerol:prolipoprotein diacylglycerol transferase